MAESSLRSDGGSHHGSAQNKTANGNEAHRVNDLLFGHVGQVSYLPVRDEDEDADIGDLSFSRVIENRK